LRPLSQKDKGELIGLLRLPLWHGVGENENGYLKLSTIGCDYNGWVVNTPR